MCLRRAGLITQRRESRSLIYSADFAAMNETYVTFFPAERPARSTVQAELPRADALVEIEVIALA